MVTFTIIIPLPTIPSEVNCLPEPVAQHLGLLLEVGEEHHEGGGGTAEVPLYVQLCHLGPVYIV